MNGSVKDLRLCQRLISIRQHPLLIAFLYSILVTIAFRIFHLISAMQLGYLIFAPMFLLFIALVPAVNLTRQFPEIKGGVFREPSAEADHTLMLAVTNAERKKYAIQFLIAQAAVRVALIGIFFIPITLCIALWPSK